MRSRKPLLLASTLLATGCIFGVGSDSQNPEPRDAGPETTSDTADDADSGRTSSCTDVGDCRDALPHAEASCRNSRCRYTCEGAWEDRDGDLSNGCELCGDRHVWHADCDGDGFAPTGAPTREICGEGDPDSPPENCRGDGTGSWTDEDPAGSSSDCNDGTQLAAPDFGSGDADFDENWMCDGLNNDCDDTSDEICCTDSSDISPATVGSEQNEQSHPTLATAPTGAAAETQFIAGWARNELDDKIVLAYLDELGDRGSHPRTTFTPKEGDASVRAASIEGLDVAATRNSVLVAYVWKTESSDDFRLGLRKYSSDLNLAETSSQLIRSTSILDNPTLDVTGDVGVAAIARKVPTGAKFHVETIGFKIDTIKNKSTVKRLTSSKNGPVNGGSIKALPSISLVAANDEFKVTWWNVEPLFDSDGKRTNRADPTIFGAAIPSSSIPSNIHAPPSDRFAIQTQDSRRTTENYTVAQTGADELTFVYPGTAGVRRRLRRARLDLESGDVDRSSLTTNQADDRHPSAVFVSPDQIGVEEASKRPVAVFWQRKKPGQQNRRELIGAGFEMVRNSTTPLTVAGPSEGLRSPRMAAGRSNLSLGALWLDSSGTDTLRFQPISRQGTPVCR